MSTNLVSYMGQIEFTISTHFLSRLWMLMECDILILIYFILLFNSLFLSFVCFLFLHWFIYLFIYLFILSYFLCVLFFVCLFAFVLLFVFCFVCLFCICFCLLCFLLHAQESERNCRSVVFRVFVSFLRYILYIYCR